MFIVQADIDWPIPSREFNFLEMNFPMGGELTKVKVKGTLYHEAMAESIMYDIYFHDCGRDHDKDQDQTSSFPKGWD